MLQEERSKTTLAVIKNALHLCEGFLCHLTYNLAVIVWLTMWISFLALVERAYPHVSSLLFCVISFKLQLAVWKSASIWIRCAWILIESFEALGLNCRIFVWGRGRITEVAGQWQDHICIIQYPFVFWVWFFGFFFSYWRMNFWAENVTPCLRRDEWDALWAFFRRWPGRLLLFTWTRVGYWNSLLMWHCFLYDRCVCVIYCCCYYY